VDWKTVFFAFFFRLNRRYGKSFKQNELNRRHQQKEKKKMKKQIMVVICIALCSLIIASTGAVVSAAASVSHTSYTLVTPCTVDGKWTTTTEWSDCWQDMIGPTPAMALFRDKWAMEMSGDSFLIHQYWLIEDLSDVATNTGDYVEICLDANAVGGTAPTTDSYRIVLTPTSMTWYKGTGTAWATMTTPASASYATSINTSFSSGPAHRIYELRYEKMAVGIGATPNIRVAVYDAGNAAAGVRAWPLGASANNPNEWGLCPYSMDPVPEGFNFGILVMLSSVAVVAGAICIRKRAVPKFGKL
jgi:hypothetical protein